MRQKSLIKIKATNRNRQKKGYCACSVTRPMFLLYGWSANTNILMFSTFSYIMTINFIGILCDITIQSNTLLRSERKRRYFSKSLTVYELFWSDTAMDPLAFVCSSRKSATRQQPPLLTRLQHPPERYWWKENTPGSLIWVDFHMKWVSELYQF